MVATGGDRGGRCDLLLGLDILGHEQQLVAHDGDGLVDALLQRHRVCAGCDVAQAFANERLGEHGCGGGAIAGDVVRLLGDLLDELSTDLLVGILEIDLLGDGDAIVGDRGGSPLLLQDDVTALRAEGHLDCVGEHVHAALQRATSLFVECNDFCHGASSSRNIRTWIITLMV
ncbi:unannotated protein [freshwater metagenome]|uniref:Unannotated protein n=1 Tax=freshwater metagenome TaxID=449393 RepID=A0A6J7P1U7_9ZZZZ